MYIFGIELDGLAAGFHAFFAIAQTEVGIAQIVPVEVIPWSKLDGLAAILHRLFVIATPYNSVFSFMSCSADRK